jgi:hypothetical protein
VLEAYVALLHVNGRLVFESHKDVLNAITLGSTKLFDSHAEVFDA